MPVPLAAVVVLAAAVGAFVQRVSGLGFSLIAAPSLALAVGAREGVALMPANLLQITVGVVTGLGLATVAFFGRLRAEPRLAITIAAGHLLAHRIDVTLARRAAITLAALATTVTVIHGLLS